LAECCGDIKTEGMAQAIRVPDQHLPGASTRRPATAANVWRRGNGLWAQTNTLAILLSLACLLTSYLFRVGKRQQYQSQPSLGQPIVCGHMIPWVGHTKVAHCLLNVRVRSPPTTPSSRSSRKTLRVSLASFSSLLFFLTAFPSIVLDSPLYCCLLRLRIFLRGSNC